MIIAHGENINGNDVVIVQQTEINFNEATLHKENNRESQQILCDQLPRLSNNCKTIYEALKRGERLSGADIILKYGMTEYRRRIKDLKDAGVQIKEEKLSNGCKVWFI